jgi:hypothetical protein
VETDQLLILQGETTIQNCYDIVLDDEDYTIGKLYEFMLYDTYFKDPILSFAGSINRTLTTRVVSLG